MDELGPTASGSRPHPGWATEVRRHGRRATMGFSWEETMRQVGKLVVVPTAAGPLETFDLDEVSVRGVD